MSSSVELKDGMRVEFVHYNSNIVEPRILRNNGVNSDEWIALNESGKVCFRGTRRQTLEMFGVEGGPRYRVVVDDNAEPEPDKGTNPKDLLGIKKAQVNLVPPASVIYQALAMEDGAAKYGPFNWRKNKVIASIYVAATMRHLYAWLDGEDDAQDSGKPHLGHALACIGILVDAKETGNLVDDRPVNGTASALIERYKKQ